MRPSAKIEYACLAILELARNWPNQEPVQIQIIAKNPGQTHSGPPAGANRRGSVPMSCVQKGHNGHCGRTTQAPPMGLLVKNSLPSPISQESKRPLRRGVPRPASIPPQSNIMFDCGGTILRYGVLSAPPNSHRTTSEAVDLELSAAKTRIPTRLSVVISAASSLYNPHSQS